MTLAQRINSLPPDIQQEVIDFMEYLLAKRAQQNETESVASNLNAVMELDRLGSEIWQETDPDQFLETLRADW